MKIICCAASGIVILRYAGNYDKWKYKWKLYLIPVLIFGIFFLDIKYNPSQVISFYFYLGGRHISCSFLNFLLKPHIVVLSSISAFRILDAIL